ncbi:LLM class flavin-dependent oxidoreductase [Terribacillus sp. 7520-G]|uniref:LLM class flavin-dependent oxidoreductase n=1 Tax=unclassified Terribacillus TaxID=2636508 RepID=UPI000BA5E021|nr:LLM class flavin-dependent oxidoreductase [Terribacillus sp. 7520-G]PAD39502.1 LLM class flavin-dependent oxidoreductase [Terribacillus sp. 7520-G]
MKLSVLDQAPIRRGMTPEEALQEAIELAQHAERLGYERYWFAEHHNTNGLVSVAPEIMATRIASATNSIKVGTGGVLLPQYSPLKVAETFHTLAGLFPGRVDLGVGRSPGGNEQTRSALADGADSGMGEFPRKLRELQGFLHNTLPREHPYRSVKASPRVKDPAPLWVLGLSEGSARRAGELGIGYVFGHFISPAKPDAMPIYKEAFRPSVSMEKPYGIVCIFVVCAETQERAEALAESQDHWLLSVGKGRDTQIPSPELIKKRQLTEADKETIRQNRKRCVIGTPEKVREELERLKDLYQADEFMIITNIHDKEAKWKSYELIKQSVDHNYIM